MKNVKKAAMILIAVLSIAMTTLMTASAQYGAAAVRENQTYTLGQMLTYAIEDEYLANARYTSDIEKFGNMRLLSRIADAEKRHIALIKPLMAKYGVPVPEDRGAQFIPVPESLTAALKAGVDSERNNMRMYDIFLKQQLPSDIRLVFTLLRSAAERHLQAFERNLGRLS